MQTENCGKTLNQVADLLLSSHPDLILPKAIRQYKEMVSKQVANHFGNRVAYGPFKGFVLTADAWWGEGDKASMILGLYEQEVLRLLTSLPVSYSNFIDLGAADGYYGIGTVFSGMFKTAYCFEASEKGRLVIQEGAKHNQVSDRVVIHGLAEKNFYELLPDAVMDGSVMLVDIEGGEFDLFDAAIFEKFKKSLIVIELHDWFFPDGDEKLKNLLSQASRYFDIDYLTMSSRDMSLFPELVNLSDIDRWLICDEGRGRLMRWLKLTPKLFNF